MSRSKRRSPAPPAAPPPDADAGAEAAAPAPERAPPRRREPGFPRTGQTPIVPPQTIAGRALTLVIAIMTFLASLTIGAVTMVDDAARAWQSDIGREVTIEVRPVDGVDIAAELSEAAALASEFPGVAGARALSDEETRRLLEPWLGAGVDLGALPVPRLVVVTVGDPSAFRVVDLAAAVEREIAGGSLDDHAAWVDRLRAMATSMVAIGVGVLVLVLVAMVLSVVFATRAAMAGNRQIIEVLHFCGAEHRFIAGEFQRHFLLLGVKGGAIGGVLALAIFAVLGMVVRRSSGLPGADQIDTLLGGLSIGLFGYGAVLLLVVGVAVLTAATSRLAVHRSLASID
ncbi:cell division protein FtsX [Chthonobacter rhizosphaerae]|uniref:cell division protein FtsX n=1 Tax=Chthonobacter rhizosphaerae TaxID=2735553 RepID=UPI0015EF7327|nr:ABC transporter permease [Chthonobacter rhizosphaerae]